jgi:hypothetical protein
VVEQFRDRVRELRRVKASELVPNPKNWRRHPKEQAAALKGAMVPVLVLDVTEAEADKLLLTIDPLAAMALADRDQVMALLETVRTDSQIGVHRVLCADCRDQAAVRRLWGDNGPRLRMIWTDPPYGVDYAAKNAYLNRTDRGNRIQVPIENDKLTAGETGLFV